MFYSDTHIISDALILDLSTICIAFAKKTPNTLDILNIFATFAVC